MRGLRLYVRPIEEDDRDAIRAFLASQQPPSPLPAYGLLGKLLGDIVAVVALELTGEALRIDRIVVARDLRKKRIGRAMLLEVEGLARKFERRRIVVDDAQDAPGFLRRVGFQLEGERWVREV